MVNGVRLNVLDGFRCFAILSVLLYHYCLLGILASPKLAAFFRHEIDLTFAWIYRAFFLLNFTSWVYFGLGIFFDSLFAGERPSRLSLALLGLSVVLEFYFLGDHTLGILFFVGMVLFFTMLCRPIWLNFLANPIFIKIGLASYPLYLLHENIGVTIIHKLGDGLGVMLTLLLTLLVAIFLIFVSKILHSQFEEPVMTFLKRRLITKN